MKELFLDDMYIFSKLEDGPSIRRSLYTLLLMSFSFIIMMPFGLRESCGKIADLSTATPKAYSPSIVIEAGGFNFDENAVQSVPELRLIQFFHDF